MNKTYTNEEIKKFAEQWGYTFATAKYELEHMNDYSGEDMIDQLFA